MTTFKYIFRSLKFYKKQHLAVLLGTILSTAILTGALIVGDSVKFSLNKLVQKRLGNVDFAMQTNDRFVTDELVHNLALHLNTNAAGILSLEGVVINTDKDIRLNSVNVLGVDSDFWQLAALEAIKLNADEIFVSENVASLLKLNIGDEVLLRIENAAVIPVNAPFSQEKPSSVAIRVILREILDDNHFGRYSLKSDQKAPFNVWVSKSLLQTKMDLENKLNTLLIQDARLNLTESNLDEAFVAVWNLDDVGLNVDSLPDSPYYELTSNRIFIDNSISDKVIANNGAEGVLTYLVNSIRYKSNETPYSFVSGVSKSMMDTDLGDDEIIINDWCALDLDLSPGDSVTLDYYVIGPYRKLTVAQKPFLVKAIESNQGKLFNNALTPNFPGLSDAASCSEWNTGVPIDLDKIRDKDEAFWNEFKATPKAIVTIETAKKLWGNQFGNYTALRVNKENTSYQNLKKELIQEIKAKDVGLQFTNVKNSGFTAASKGVDFGELFLSLSFFVIAAGVLLLILIYTLNIISRKSEIGVLISLGLTPRKIIRIFLSESVITLIFGGFIGVALGMLYNLLVLKGLNTIWFDAVQTNALEIYINPKTLIIGGLAGMIIALLSIFLVINKRLKLQASQSVKVISNVRIPFKRNKIIAIVSFMAALAMVMASIVSSKPINPEMFLTAGGLFLVGLVSVINLLLQLQTSQFEAKAFGIVKLALKNMGRNRTRSIMAILLLALGTFSVIITGANRKTFYGAIENHHSGTGGFLYWVENSLPIIHDLNTQPGMEAFNFDDEAISDSITFVQMLALDGDDASCLNLNQVQNPRILGLDLTAFEKNNPFSFAKLNEGVSTDSPWSELNKSYDKNIIPAYVDQTVITWGLMKKVGDTLLYKDEFGNDLYLVIAGGLNNSIFQGNILISDQHFRRHFPSVSGSQVMLIEGKAMNSEAIVTFLSFYFRDFGIDFTLANERLAEFNSVENTYLNVFMILGGLGIVIGTLGFGIIVLRNKLERRQELALLTAVGIKSKQLFKLVFVEHFMLLIVGLLIGILSAFVGILPSLISPAFSASIGFVCLLVILILLNGMVWIWLSSGISEDRSLIAALRKE